MYQSIDVDSLEESLADLLRAEKPAEAIDLLAAAWPTISTTHGARLRRLIDSVPESAWSSDPRMLAAMGASYRSLGSTSRSAAVPWFRSAEALLLARPASVPTAAAVSLHHSAALRSLGQLESALEKAESAWTLLDGDVSLPASVRVRSQAQTAVQLGIARLHLGDYDGALAMLRLALGLSDHNLTRSELIECLSGLSLLKYLSGDLEAASRLASRARAESDTSGLLASRFGAGALIAQTLVAVEQNALEEAITLSSQVTEAAQRSEWEPFAYYARASVAVIDGRHIEGLDHVRRALETARAWEGKPPVRPMCDTLRGVLLMHVGEFAAALSAFEAVEPSGDHTICPGRFVAGIRYKAGDSAGCLAALHDCELLGEAHSALTIVDVLLLKAAASYDLDNTSGADVALDRALLLAAANGMRTPFLMISATAMHRMLGRASDRSQPADVHDLLQELRTIPGTATTGSLTPLSERERDIAQYLFEDKTVSQIASELYISTNTVKTHVRSIYRKLSANNRKDAVRRVRELGLDPNITPR